VARPRVRDQRPPSQNELRTAIVRLERPRAIDVMTIVNDLGGEVCDAGSKPEEMRTLVSNVGSLRSSRYFSRNQTTPGMLDPGARRNAAIDLRCPENWNQGDEH